MMSLLMTPLLAAAVAADQHADVLAQRRSEATVVEKPVEAAPQLAQAAPPGPRGEGPPRHGPPEFGAPPPGPPYLRGLALTEAQQDKVFEIQHAQAPQLRQRLRELAKAREELRALARAERFDEARAAAVAEASGRAAAAIALIHARSEAAIWALLTPEQRQKAAEMRPPEMPPRDGIRPLR